MNVSPHSVHILFKKMFFKYDNYDTKVQLKFIQS